MNVFGWVVLAAAATAAVADGWAVARGSRAVAQLAGPAVPVLLGLWAWLAHADATAPGRWLLLGLVARLVGAVLLLDDGSVRRLAAGALALLVGDLALLAGLLALPPRAGAPGAVVALAVLALGAAGVVAVRRRALAAEPALAGPATAYGVVLVLIAAVAWWREELLPAAGLTLLAAGDLLRGTDRLGRSPGRRALPAALAVTAHGAAALVSVGLVRPDLVG